MLIRNFHLNLLKELFDWLALRDIIRLSVHQIFGQSETLHELLKNRSTVFERKFGNFADGIEWDWKQIKGFQKWSHDAEIICPELHLGDPLLVAYKKWKMPLLTRAIECSPDSPAKVNSFVDVVSISPLVSEVRCSSLSVKQLITLFGSAPQLLSVYCSTIATKDASGPLKAHLTKVKGMYINNLDGNSKNLLEVLKLLGNLTELSFSRNCELSEHFLGTLGDAIGDRLTILRILRLSEAASDFKGIFSKFKKLKVLSIHDARYHDSSPYLGELCTLTTLQEIDMSQLSFDESTKFVQFMKALSQLRSLRTAQFDYEREDHFIMDRMALRRDIQNLQYVQDFSALFPLIPNLLEVDLHAVTAVNFCLWAIARHNPRLTALRCYWIAESMDLGLCAVAVHCLKLKEVVLLHCGDCNFTPIHLLFLMKRLHNATISEAFMEHLRRYAYEAEISLRSSHFLYCSFLGGGREHLSKICGFLYCDDRKRISITSYENIPLGKTSIASLFAELQSDRRFQLNDTEELPQYRRLHTLLAAIDAYNGSCGRLVLTDILYTLHGMPYVALQRYFTYSLMDLFIVKRDFGCSSYSKKTMMHTINDILGHASACCPHLQLLGLNEEDISLETLQSTLLRFQHLRVLLLGSELNIGFDVIANLLRSLSRLEVFVVQLQEIWCDDTKQIHRFNREFDGKLRIDWNVRNFQKYTQLRHSYDKNTMVEKIERLLRIAFETK